MQFKAVEHDSSCGPFPMRIHSNSLFIAGLVLGWDLNLALEVDPQKRVLERMSQRCDNHLLCYPRKRPRREDPESHGVQRRRYRCPADWERGSVVTHP